MIICGVFFTAGLTIAAIGPSLPVLAVQIDVDVAALGGLFTTFSAGVMLAQLGVARASRRFGQRATLAASMLLTGAGCLAIAQGISLLALFGAALLGGFGFGGVMATGNTLVAQLFPSGSTAALNGINLFFGVGSIVGPSLAAAANARLSAPQIALWIGAGAMAALSPVVLGAVAGGAGGAATARAGARSAAPVRSWLLGFLLLVYTGTEIGFGAWLTLYMISSAAMDVASAALVVSGFWLALTSGRALVVALGARISAHGLLRLCLGGLLLGAVLLALGIGNIALTLAGVLLFGLSCGPVFPTIVALVASSAGAAAATSQVLLLGNCGALLVPALLGVLLTRYGPPAVTALLVLAALLMIGLGVAAMRPRPEAALPEEADCIPAQ
jgi:MFS transporter, FHS family, L-fucose permease